MRRRLDLAFYVDFLECDALRGFENMASFSGKEA